MSAQTSQSDTALNGAEAMVRMLQAHQVEYVFGLCGDTTLPFYDALHRLDHGIDRGLTHRHARSVLLSPLECRHHSAE